ncbi:MAG: SCP2 sterol-binding domain-containing protein [Bacillota bacterium]
MSEAFIFGSREWFETAKKKLQESEDLKKGSKDWVGCMRCIIDAEDEEAVKDYTTEDGIKAITGMIGMLSVEDRLKFSDTGLGRLFDKLGVSLERDPDSEIPAEVMDKVKDLTLEDFRGVVIYASFEPHLGELREMDPIAPDARLDAPFTISGKYKFWKKLCSGQQSIIQLVMSGKMKLKGDIKYILKRMAAVNALMNTYKSIPLK